MTKHDKFIYDLLAVIFSAFFISIINCIVPDEPFILNFIYSTLLLLLIILLVKLAIVILSFLFTRDLTEQEWLTLKDCNLYHYTEIENAPLIQNKNIGYNKVFLKTSKNIIVNLLSNFKPTVYFFINIPSKHDIKTNLSVRKNNCIVVVKLCNLDKDHIKIRRNKKILLYTDDYIGNGKILK